jgi:hypothetical protein
VKKLEKIKTKKRIWCLNGQLRLKKVFSEAWRDIKVIVSLVMADTVRSTPPSMQEAGRVVSS